MDEEELVAPALEEEEAEVNFEAPEEEQQEEESVEEYKERLAKAEELANNYKTRAEKAEAKAKKPAEAKKDDIDSRDMMALIRANVPDEDVDQVVEFAKFKKIPVAEALKSNVVKTMLEDSAEMRKTAQASNTGVARRAGVKLTDEMILQNAKQSGVLPEGDDDMNRLIDAQIEQSTVFRKR